MHASLLITDAAAVLQGIPLVSAMSLAYSSTNACNAITATSASSRGKEKEKAEGVSSSLGKRSCKTEPEEGLLMKGQEGAFKKTSAGRGQSPRRCGN